MKILLTILFLSLLSSPSWSVSYDDLVVRDGLYYKKFSEVPFSGKVTGLRNGSIKNGKAEGEWTHYYENGQLFVKGNWKNGKTEGVFVTYWENGQLMTKGNYKNGKKDGLWVYYFEAGGFNASWSGTFKNGVKISD